MPKKRRSRQRQRFTPRPAPLPDAHEEREERVVPRETIRPRFTRPGTIGRAVGQPSPTLLKAATAEVGYVTKDLRRIAVVAAGSIALLAVASIAGNLLLK